MGSQRTDVGIRRFEPAPREGVLSSIAERHGWEVPGGAMVTNPPSPPFESVRVVGYDNLARVYETAIYDSLGTNIIRQLGELNAEGDLGFRYSYTDMTTGATVNRRTIIRRMLSPDEWLEAVFEHSPVPNGK